VGKEGGREGGREGGKAVNQTKKIEEEHHITQNVSAGRWERWVGREGGEGAFGYLCMRVLICFFSLFL